MPYGFLLPERGVASLLLHIVGLLAAVIAAGALIWVASRWRGIPSTDRRLAAPSTDGLSDPDGGRSTALR